MNLNERFTNIADRVSEYLGAWWRLRKLPPLVPLALLYIMLTRFADLATCLLTYAFTGYSFSCDVTRGKADWLASRPDPADERATAACTCHLRLVLGFSALASRLSNGVEVGIAARAPRIEVLAPDEGTTAAGAGNHLHLEGLAVEAHMALAAQRAAIAHFVTQFRMLGVWPDVVCRKALLALLALTEARLADVVVALQHGLAPCQVLWIGKAIPGLAPLPVRVCGTFGNCCQSTCSPVQRADVFPVLTQAMSVAQLIDRRHGYAHLRCEHRVRSSGIPLSETLHVHTTTVPPLDGLRQENRSADHGSD